VSSGKHGGGRQNEVLPTSFVEYDVRITQVVKKEKDDWNLTKFVCCPSKVKSQSQLWKFVNPATDNNSRHHPLPSHVSHRYLSSCVICVHTALHQIS
jgi:hypothetical protein